MPPVSAQRESGSSWYYVFTELPAIFHKTQNNKWHLLSGKAGQFFQFNCYLILGCHSKVPTVAQRSMPWYVMTVLPFSPIVSRQYQTHHITGQTPWIFSCVTSARKNDGQFNPPWPFKDTQPAFLPWSPVRIRSQAPITLQFTDHSQSPALSPSRLYILTVSE